MKFKLALLIAAFANVHAYTQTLFTYGTKKVSSAEFIRAFRKNVEPGKTGSQDVRDYLELYTNFRLKVQDAHDMGLDSVINRQDDLAAFRSQIEDQYLYDTALASRLVSEARSRGQKEIRVAHIFIPYRIEYVTDPFMELAVSTEDSIKARQRINEAYERLKKGEDFGAVALAYSQDPTVRENKGDLGFITVFALPYALESLAFPLKPGEFSAPFASGKGFHIFRKTAERPALGRLEIRQILLAVDPEGDARAKQEQKKLADSIYNALLNGSSFAALAKQFSNDKTSSNNGGNVTGFMTGTYDRLFEEKVFGIPNEGQTIPPFETALGYHIVQKIRYTPVSDSSFAGVAWADAVALDDRQRLPRTAFAATTPSLTGVKVLVKDLQELKRYTDSMIANGKALSPVYNQGTTLFEFPKGKVDMPEWITFISGNKYTGQIQFNNLWNQFLIRQSLDYYRRNLESYNPAFLDQLNDFKDGNLLFEAMERKVWQAAANDTALQRKIYRENPSKFTWDKSADAIVFTVTDSLTAAGLHYDIVRDPGIWRTRMEISEGRVLADSSRIDIDLISSSPSELKAGQCTPLLMNPNDGSASFVYVVRIYNEPAAKSFEQAKGQVINECHRILEDQWVSTLRKKYPVKLDKKAWDKVLKELTR